MHLKKARKGKWNLVINCDRGTCNVSCCMAQLYLGHTWVPILTQFWVLNLTSLEGWEDDWQTFRRSQGRQEQSPRVTNVY